MDEITRDVYLSDYYTASSIRELLQNGIKTVVYIGIEPKEDFVLEDYENAGIKSFWWPCHDSLDANIKEFFPKVLHIMETMPKPVLFHCYMGISRSASLVIAYLIYDMKIDYIEAFRRVKMKRTQISPNASFRKQLREWEKEVLSSTTSPQLKTRE
jgi:protein-tyrosine phosphatase